MQISMLSYVLILNLCIHAMNPKVFKINSRSTLNPCQWDSDCEIRCLNGENITNSYIESIQSMYDEVWDTILNSNNFKIFTLYFIARRMPLAWH